MGLYVVERDFPDAHKISETDLECMKNTSRQVCQRGMMMGFAWLTSYVVENKFFCVFRSPDEETIRRHSFLCGWPITKISKIESVVATDPAPAKRIDDHPDVRAMLASHAREYEADEGGSEHGR